MTDEKKNKKQLDKLAERLESVRLTRPKRLELLRQQAQLGDERDAAVKAARRAASDRPGD